jgi:NAD(P)-dependent dehydrogenase (short-subunit alcohol dehydrogenase family)
MPSYVITGASKGLGREFLNQLSSDSNNTVIGLVRNKAATDERVATELSGRSNITIMQADVCDYEALKKAAAETAEITGGSLDYLIANAAFQSHFDAFDGIGALAPKPEEINSHFHSYFDTNVLANIHLYNIFMPQILKSQIKKVIFITSGHADVDFVNKYDIEVAGLYSAGKAAMNMINAKFSAQYKSQGVLFLSLAPGMVEVGQFANVDPAKLSSLQGMVAKFKEYAPHFTGPITPEESIKLMLGVIESSSVENGRGGAFISQLGNRQWL